ncbi:MAG: flavodoxin-dependent (E)-4-hydroxy-3-methylbut-2-enyl-diphosphate synthase [Ruminococcaceae bacterium]|nr:flavodoxin-dependent (E)-4-hydroxy-3-methylbut-2-enyl-diphosphate synthase [Oscillospiraceae bacterium]
MNKRISKKIKIGNTFIGGDTPVSVQSMTNTDTCDIDATYNQVKALQDRGCDIVRMAVPNKEASTIFYKLKEKGITIPLVADIHFDYKLAILSAENGADKIRINPGNIGSDDNIKAVVKSCNEKSIPIRVGVNSGSLDKEILAKYGHVCADALCESLLKSAAILERFDFNNIVLAIKSSDPRMMIDANRKAAQLCDYPLHLGVTEAGSMRMGVMKSAVGIGSLLTEGIGDTMRVSLTADPLYEIDWGIKILEAAGIREKKGIEIVSCPTCGRTQIDLIGLVDEFESRMTTEVTNKKPLKVAIMGCVVNGPGEAKEADIGIAGGKGEALLFKKGEIIRKLPEDGLVTALIDEINKM